MSLMNPRSIVTYLSKSFGFNSVIKKDSEGKFESLISEIENQFQVLFICYFKPKNKNYWTGTLMIFSCVDGIYFYSVRKIKIVS